MLAAVSKDGHALKFATEEFLKGDREIVLATVSKDGLALLWCATEELKGDREIVLAAVSQYGLALQHVTEELKADTEIVMKAVSQNGVALQFATKELKADEEMMRHALEQSPENLVGLKVSLLSGRCCSEIFPISVLHRDTGRRTALFCCAVISGPGSRSRDEHRYSRVRKGGRRQGGPRHKLS